MVSSTDLSGNAATSSESSFTTPDVPDTTAPIITSLLVGSVSSSSATISWTTDENATSKAWYDLTTPLVITGSTSFAEESSLIVGHSLDLTGLTASSTYYYKVSSDDEPGNTATSAEQSFITQ